MKLELIEDIDGGVYVLQDKGSVIGVIPLLDDAKEIVVAVNKYEEQRVFLETIKGYLEAYPPAGVRDMDRWAKGKGFPTMDEILVRFEQVLKVDKVIIRDEETYEEDID